MQTHELFDLTYPQKNIWITEEFFKGTSVNNICASATIFENMNEQLLKQAINNVVKQNDSFRLHFILEGNSVKQYVSEYRSFKIETEYITNKKQLDKIEKEESSYIFNVFDSDLFKFKIVFLKNTFTYIILTVNHLISDSWSMGLTIQEILKNYNNLYNKKESDSKNPSYIDYINSEIKYKSSKRFENDKQYWDKLFETIPEQATIPSSVKSFKDISYKAERFSFELEKNVIDNITAYCKENNFSIFNFFMTIFSIYVNRVSNIDDFVIGTPILNRTTIKDKHTIGLFINTIPVRVKNLKNHAFTDLVKISSKNMIGILKHQKYSYSSILEDIRKKNSNVPSLYNILISYQITKAFDKKLGNYETSWIFNNTNANDISIHIYDINDTGKLILNYDYLIDKYNEKDMIAINNRIINIINQVLKDPNISYENIEVVTPVEKEKILNEFNATTINYKKSKTVVDLFEKQVKKTPNKTAIVFGDRGLTYKQLNQNANSLARYLISHGINKNDIVGIMVNRSLEMAIGLIAILKCGATYLPIDPEYPPKRVCYMLENSKAKAILVNESTVNLVDNKYKKIDISIYNEFYDKFKNTNLNLRILPSQIMYLIYTSGSTGNPKGVMVTHKNVYNFIIGMKNIIDFSDNKTMVSLTTICFDTFGFEFWCSLTSGLKLVIANEFEQKNVSAFNKLCIKHNVSIIQSTPSRFLAFLKDKSSVEYLKNATEILVAGEAFPNNLLKKLKQFSNANIYNMYGPTETTIYSTMKDLTNTDFITIGVPTANTSCYILDNNLNILPPYSVGTLYIGGDGVSKGYFKNETLTNEKFIDYHGNIIYNTNDLAYYTSSGEIVHMGRADYQIKIRGYRVELGEIENAISNFKDISSCAVIYKNIKNRHLLCAFYTSQKEISVSNLKQYLMNILPIYMVPNKFICLDKMPHTPNGKIDRKSLSSIEFIDDEDFVSPQNPIEETLCSIIKEIIDIDKINMNDNLFTIGFDSINIIEISIKIKEIFGIEISIKDLYNSHSISELAKIIEKFGTKKIIHHLPKAKKMDLYPLSFEQKEIFYASQIVKNSTVYNVSGGFLINLKLSTQKIKSTFDKIIENQPSLRTCFKIVDGVCYQKILDNVNIEINAYEDDLSNLKNLINHFPKPFNLEVAPLLRIEVHYSKNKTLILVDSHHIIMDGTSIYLLLKDFCEIYSGNDIKKLDYTYIDYTMWERDFENSEDSNKFDKYWISKINTSDLPILNLPYDFPITNVKTFNGDSVELKLDDSVFEMVNSISKKYSISPYTIFISIFYVLIYKYTGQIDIIFGSPMDLRMSSETQNIIGMLVNNVLLRNQLNPMQNFSEFLRDTQTIVKEALSNQPYPYDKLIEKLNIKSNSLLDVVFTYQTSHNKKPSINNNELNLLRPDTTTSKFNLLLEIIPDDNTIRIEYNTNLFKHNTVESMLKHYIFLLNNLTLNINKKINDINIITDEELALINKFNNTYESINSDTVVSIFEDIVKKYPNHTAVICSDEALTYKELNEKANSLAHYLIKKGIGRNDIVCIMTNRSLETIVCMLGILKSGAAFFNVDPTYPIERTKYYLSDSKTKYVLTQSELKDRVSEIENCIEIDLNNKKIYNNKNIQNPNVKGEPSDLSYIIYTSGSTGTPKGVMLHQLGFANMVKAMTKVLDYLKDGYNHTIASVTSTPFDIFVYEIFVSLTHGLKVVMANNAEHRNPKLLDKLIRKYNVDVMTVTPSLMKINYDNREPNSALALVKNMVFGGEPLPEKFIKDLHKLADDITIYNIYGPSEITVLSNVQNLDGEKEITVGPPIMNTQMYILDKNMKQLPIGVAGEIYIAGVQVGIGYIGKPEMTSSKFLDNPFGDGKIYRSGDIGRWTFDGKIQILGRIDNQIKLRGLRIELSEIENIIANIDGVTSTIVNKTQVAGKEVLCAYYVSEKPIPESEIRTTLQKSLPQYMVPTYIVYLEKMPYTLNRKIDRKALPLPNLKTSLSFKEININNLSSNEEKLLQIWKNILKTDDISVDDNFFDIGGDSISAIQIQIESLKYGLKFEYADIFNYPTVKKLSNKLPTSEDSFIEKYNYEKVNNVLKRNSIDNIKEIKKANIKNILLIGSTGYIGSHIIKDFLKQNTGKIYCLIREKNNQDPVFRLKQKLNFYFGDSYTNAIFNRIHVVKGDITETKLGLSDSDYNLIKNDIDVVINAGANVKHYGLKNDFYNINVLGTKNITEFCKNEHKRLLHISTISISGSGEREEAIDESAIKESNQKQFYENNIYVKQKITGIYSTTKYEAELIVLEAIADGLDAQILRLGNITNRYSDGGFQFNVGDNAFANRLKTFIELGAFPKYLLKHSIELTPVDLASQAIVKILNYTSPCNVFHIYNTHLMPIKLLIDTLSQLNYEILPMPNKMFSLLITGILEDPKLKNSLSGIIYDLDENKKLIYTYNVSLHSEFTEKYLNKIGFSWKDIDKDYIIKYIKYFENINFIQINELNKK